MHKLPTKSSFMIFALSLAFLVVSASAMTARAQSFVEIGRLYSEQKYDSALVMIEQAMEKDSLRAWLWLRKDDVLRQMDAPDERIATLSRMVEVFPTETTAHTRLAEIWLDTNAVDRARHHIDQALKANQNNSVSVLYLAGRIMQAAERPDSAVVLYKQAWKQIEKNHFLWIVE